MWVFSATIKWDIFHDKFHHFIAHISTNAINMWFMELVLRILALGILICKGYKLTQVMILAFHFACAKVAWFGSTFFSYICSKMLKSFLTRLIHGKSSKHGSTRDNIAQGNFVERSPSILHAPQIWHECQQYYFSQRYLTQNHFERCFEWSAHQHTWPLLSATAMAHAFSSATNMKGFQLHTFL